MINIREINYANYGRCVEMSNGIVEAVITVDCGPRIIRYAFCGKDNMMYEDINRLGCEKGSAFDEFYGDGAVWYSYGGHRLWVSPESLPRTYYPDNGTVEYEINGNSVKFICPEQVRNNIKMITTVTLAETSSDVIVSHEVINTGAFEVEFAAWALSVMSGGGMCVVAQPTRNTGLLSNRAIALWPYAKMTDDRVYWGESYITLTQKKDCASPFKFGLTNESGYAMLFNHDCLFVKNYTHDMNGTYPDGGMSFESYTNSEFIEVETLSPLKKLTPGESVVHSEQWRLFADVKKPAQNDEAAIAEAVRNIGL